MREYEMLTKLMRLLTIKLVKIQYKMRMPGIGEDTMKSVLLCSPPGGGTMGGGLQDLLQDLLTLAFAHRLLVFHTGVLSLPWTVCEAVCVHFDECIYCNMVTGSSVHIHWSAHRIIVLGGWNPLKESCT